MKKLFAMIVCIALIIGVLSVNVFAADDLTLDAEGEAKSVKSWTELMSAVASAKDGDEIVLSGPILNTEKKDRIKVDGKAITIDLMGNTVDRKRTSSQADGHVFEVVNGAVLTIKDSVGGGTITGGWANNGGAINIDAASKCIINGSINITGNKAEIDGGAFCVKGSLEMTGAVVTGNSAKDNGGGIYSDKKLRIKGSTITGNSAGDRGCGIFIGGNSEPTDIEGKIVVQNNDQSSNGREVYLREGRMLNLTGPLSEGTMIGITMQDGHGTFTKNYKNYHKDIEPETFFYSPEKLELGLAGTGADTGEIYLNWATMFWKTDYEFSFANSSDIFNTVKYTLLDKDLEKMMKYLDKINCGYYKDIYINKMNKKWGGSCYGMSASVLLDYFGRIGFNENLDPSKNKMYDVLEHGGDDAVEYEEKRKRVTSAINYYHLAQHLPPSWEKQRGYSVQCGSMEEGLRRLVELSKKGDLIMLGYQYIDNNRYCGHRIVGKGYGGTDSNGDHILLAYDNRYPSKDTKITITKDFSKYILHGKRDEEAVKVYFLTDLSEFDKIDFDGPNNDMIIDFGDSSKLMDGSLTQITVPLDSVSDTTTVKNDKGEILKLTNGDVDNDSSMEVVAEQMITNDSDGEDPSVSLAFLVKDSDSFTFDSTSNDIEASVVSDTYYSDVSTENADSVKITEEETLVSGDKASYDVTHSVESELCEMVSIGGTTNGDSTISFTDDVIDIDGSDGGYIYLTIYVGGKGFQSIPIDIKAFLEGVKIEDIVKDPCKYGHMLRMHEAQDATFNKHGNIEYFTCNNCGKAFVFKDWRKETEIQLKDTVIEKIETVLLDKISFTYNGSVQRPEFIIKDSAGKTIDSDHYTAVFSNKNSKNAGPYKATVTFRNGYSGTKSLTYKINKASNPMKVKGRKPTAKASKNTTIKKADAFTVRKAKGKVKFKKISGSGKIRVASSGKVTVKRGLKKGRTYAVKVKVTAEGNSNYKAKSENVTLKIRVR